MVHYVIPEVDRGEPILIREVEVLEGYTLEDLEQRIHAEEHQMLVEATSKLATEIILAKQQSKQ
jgi:phosphoribosylglycinamide formyltransferase